MHIFISMGKVVVTLNLPTSSAEKKYTRSFSGVFSHSLSLSHSLSFACTVYLELAIKPYTLTHLHTDLRKETMSVCFRLDFLLINYGMWNGRNAECEREGVMWKREGGWREWYGKFPNKDFARTHTHTSREVESKRKKEPLSVFGIKKIFIFILMLSIQDTHTHTRIYTH